MITEKDFNKLPYVNFRKFRAMLNQDPYFFKRNKQLK